MVFRLINVHIFLYIRAQIDAPAGLEAHYARNYFCLSKNVDEGIVSPRHFTVDPSPYFNLEKNLNAPSRPSEHPPVGGENVKTFIVVWFDGISPRHFTADSGPYCCMVRWYCYRILSPSRTLSPCTAGRPR